MRRSTSPGACLARHSLAALLVLSAFIAAGMLTLSIELYLISERSARNGLEQDFHREADSAFMRLESNYKVLFRGWYPPPSRQRFEGIPNIRVFVLRAGVQHAATSLFASETPFVPRVKFDLQANYVLQDTVRPVAALFVQRVPMESLLAYNTYAAFQNSRSKMIRVCVCSLDSVCLGGFQVAAFVMAQLTAPAYQ